MEGLGYSTFEVRARAVAAALEGNPIGQVARAYGVERTTLHRWLQRYHQQGEAGLQRQPVSGRPRKLAGRAEYLLKRMALAPASRYGFETDLWTVGRLHAVLVRDYHEDVSEGLAISSCSTASRTAGTFPKPDWKHTSKIGTPATRSR